MKASLVAQARLRAAAGLGLVFSAGLLTLSRKTIANTLSRTEMATLKNALEMKAISDAIDLTPILDNIGDAALASAADGDYQTTVSIKDSVYAKRITQIASQLVALGYEVTVKDFEITLSWVNAK